MKLYSAKYAPNPLRVEVFLKEKGIFDQIEIIEVELAEEAKGQEHLTRNLLGQVPVLELDDGRFLSESRAICAYLEGLYPEPNLLGNGFEEAAFIEMYDRQIEHGLLYNVMQWVRHTHPGLAKLEKPQVAEWGASCEAKARRAAGIFDTGLAINQYAAGDRFTIADITLFSGLNFGRLVKFKAWEEYENIGRWYNELMERPAFK